LGQPVTQTAMRGRRGGARTDRRCGGVDPRKLHGRSRQQGSRRRRLQESLRGDHLRRAPPIQGSPIEVWEQASDHENIPGQSGQPSRDTNSCTHKHGNTITHILWVLTDASVCVQWIKWYVYVCAMTLIIVPWLKKSAQEWRNRTPNTTNWVCAVCLVFW